MRSVELLDVLEWLSSAPAELWLLPPLVILAAIFGISLARRQMRLNRLEAIAQRVGLRLNANSIFHASEIVGDFRGRALEMTSVSGRQSADYAKTCTRVTVEVMNPALMSLRLYRQDILDSILTAAGMQDIKVGDETFDKRYIIQSDDAKMAQRLLKDEAIRNGLVRADVQSLEMYNTRLCCYYGREENDADHAELLFNALSDLADGIDALNPDYKPEVIGPGLPNTA